METKKTMILGASTNPNRYANLAANKLVAFGHPIVNVGLKPGVVAGMPIESPEAIHEDIDTLTLYISPQNQPPLYDYIIETRPKRIIFNPGTENFMLQQLAVARGIIVENACTLVLLTTGQF